MKDFLEKIISLAGSKDIFISSHGYEELSSDNIKIRDILQNMQAAEGIDYYPEYSKGHCILVLIFDNDGKPVHVVWGIPRGDDSPAVLVTAYRPDPSKWIDFRRRKKHEEKNN